MPTPTPPPAEFDAHAQRYTETLDRSVSLSGETSQDFARLKVDLILEIAQRHLGPLTSQTWLDLGCGTGMALDLLEGRCARRVGIDVSAEMVKVAQQRVRGADLRCVPPGPLPFADATFDVSFCFCVLHHVPPEQRAGFVAEMARVTRPGGLLFTFEHNPRNPITRRIVDACPLDQDAVLLDQAEAHGLFTTAGLEVVEARYYLFFPGWLKMLRPLERMLGSLPLGGQYLVAARRSPA